MLQIQVNGGQFSLNVIEEQEEEVLALIHSNPQDVHAALCRELRIGMYTPACHRIQFALMRTQLEINSGGSLIAMFGGDLVCYSCNLNLNDQSPSIVACLSCGVTKMKNFRMLNIRPLSKMPSVTLTYKI